MSKEKGLTESDRGEAFAALSHDDRPTTFKDTLKDMAESSSLHGITKIVSSRQIIVKVLWSLLVLAAFSVFSIQLYYLFNTYYSYPVQTSVKLDFDSIAFPAITLCNMNPVRKSKLDNSEELTEVLKSKDNQQSVYYGKKRRKRRKRETHRENEPFEAFMETKSEYEGEINNENDFNTADSVSQSSNDINMKVQSLDSGNSKSTSLNYNDTSKDFNSEKRLIHENNHKTFNIDRKQESEQNQKHSSQKVKPTASRRNENLVQVFANDVVNSDHQISGGLNDKVGRFKRDAGYSSADVVPSSSILNTYLVDSSRYIQTTMSSMTAMPASLLSSKDSKISTSLMTASTEIYLESSQLSQDIFSSEKSNYKHFSLSTEDLYDFLSSENPMSSNYAMHSNIIDSSSGNAAGTQTGSGGSDQGNGGVDSGSGGSYSGGGGSYSGGGGSYSGGSDSYTGSYYYSDYSSGGSSAYYYDWSGSYYYPYFEQLNAVKDEWEERVENFKELIKNESVELRKEIGHQKEDMMLSATFAGRVQNVSHFKDFMSVEYGNCYTIESSNYVAWRSGPTHALKLTLNVEIDEYVDNFSTGYGIRIVFHEPGTYPLPSHEGITLSPGTETNIGLRRVHISRLGKPHGNCIDGKEFKSRYNKKYSISACYEFCRILEAIKECDCIPAEAPDEVHLNSTALPVCNTTDETVEKCLLSVDIIFDSGEVACHCNGPCQETVYAKTLSSTFWPNNDYLDILISDICKTKNTTHFWSYACSSLSYLQNYELDYYRNNFLRVLIYYEDLNYETITEEPMYESVRFLSDIGGAMGLFLGASVLSFVEFVQLILEVFLFLKHKNERHTRVVDFKKPID
ncbi:amiloride-sensitive sodium channel subunit alpha-like [Ruditapes philippinarum]|uniref:amiloride-sensitive sodium channel subunit alpha-like n=1 Tax=Ruditapes philippinarum TaxID=129788 RepID=UPI00295B03CF|nr:amiloride-sensitive sodium channel subunit alpha-like [Ruditapes philippinarum]